MTRSATVTASEANRYFSRILERVRRGERINITSHGKIVAELVPSDPDEKTARIAAMQEHLTELKKRNFKVIGPWTRAELYERD
jgi:prevent-host-death family protein